MLKIGRIYFIFFCIVAKRKTLYVLKNDLDSVSNCNDGRIVVKFYLLCIFIELIINEVKNNVLFLVSSLSVIFTKNHKMIIF